MLTNSNNDKNLQRKKRLEILDKVFLLLRPDNTPLFLKPIRSMTDAICQLSGKTIQAGDFTYRCYANPIRLSPTGNCKALVSEAIKHDDKILPKGFVLMRIPSYEQVMDLTEIKTMKNKLSEIISDQDMNLLVKNTRKIKSKE